MYGNGPRLSVLTQAGPFNPATPARRPQGARRRGIAPGLFVANPDKSDDEGSSPRSPTRGSPITTSSSSSGRAGGPVLPAGAASQCIARGGLATVPAPQSSQIPSPASFHSPHDYEPTPPPTASPVRLQPSPQPERHARRAFTTPVQDNFARPTHEPRTASGSSVLHGHPPSSPSRALPLLPSPPLRSAQPSVVPSSAPPQNAPLVPPPLYPTPSSIRSHPDYLQRRRDEHTASPEKAMSPATHTSEGRVTVMGINSPEASYRIRSGSVQNMVRLQVTTDNEQFTLVDITGMQTAEAIRESVFSKVSTEARAS